MQYENPQSISETPAQAPAAEENKDAQLAKQLGGRIVALRKQLGLTQERLAHAAGLKSKGYLSRIERGERLPSLGVLGRLAACLNVEVRDLLIFPQNDAQAQAMEAVRTAGADAATQIVSMFPR